MEKQIFETPAQTLKNRVKTLQARMKQINKTVIAIDFQKFVIECNPKYNTPDGIEFIRKVWYKTATSIELTDIMEQMVINTKAD